MEPFRFQFPVTCMCVSLERLVCRTDWPTFQCDIQLPPILFSFFVFWGRLQLSRKYTFNIFIRTPTHPTVQILFSACKINCFHGALV
uniref:Uncharacterized protein n=1 Tax=Pyxicephalus adspersus TaxID=30357 RepID=A0AAV3AW20_PYXAD|nr:TPA: hypothetical protein GDO54_007349 [Pyxicephalus adspersus]